MTQRRAFMGTMGLGLLTAHRRAYAQAPAKVQRVAHLSAPSTGRTRPNFEFFLDGLRKLGYDPGRSLHVEDLRGDPSKPEQFAALATRLVAQGFDVILAAGPLSIEAVARTTRAIPIVGIDLESDPVARGWVASLARPGGNVTGLFLDIPEMSGKQLQFLQEAKPKLSRVAVLGDARVADLQFKAIEAAARTAGLALQILPITSHNEIEGAVAEAVRQRAEGLVVLTSPLIFSGQPRVAEHALKQRIATICPFVPSFVEVGGLLAYGPDFPDLYRRAAAYVDRILKGAKAVDLPVQRPEKFELAINLKTAKALGLTIPQALLLRADRVIGGSGH